MLSTLYAASQKKMAAKKNRLENEGVKGSTIVDIGTLIIIDYILYQSSQLLTIEDSKLNCTRSLITTVSMTVSN